MVCDKCGTEVTKKNKYCPKCGEAVNAKKKKSPEIKEYNLKDKEIQKLSESFISRDEKYIASLGNGYIMNFLTNKSIKKGFAFITNKRVYFKGSCLSGRGRVLVKTNEERTVDVKNITGSGFIYKRYWGKVIALIITLLASLAGTIVIAWEGYGQTIYHFNWKYHQRFYEIYETAINEWEEISWESGDYGYHGFYHKGPRFEIGIRLDGLEFTRIAKGNYDINVFFSKMDPKPNLEDIKDEVIQELINKKNAHSSPSLSKVVGYSYPYLACIGLGLSLLSICSIGIKNYLLKRKTLFRIEYAGGGIAFDVSFYAKAEIDDFQKQLRRVKDYAEETATIKTVALEAPEQASTQSNMSDELRKYADLLKEGLITQDEYDIMKKKILEL